jgi:NAD(P)-dependent dehydrogenase (short-subunit alcohol dehydrogenase family)
MKVLITGGMGVIGAETSRRLVREGYRPVIFARHRDDWLVRDILDEVDIELGDVLDDLETGIADYLDSLERLEAN